LLQEYAKKANAKVFLPDFMDGKITRSLVIAGFNKD